MLAFKIQDKRKNERFLRCLLWLAQEGAPLATVSSIDYRQQGAGDPSLSYGVDGAVFTYWTIGVNRSLPAVSIDSTM